MAGEEDGAEKERGAILPQVASPEEGFEEAKRRIRACADSGSDTLDLGGLLLWELPGELLELRWLKRLYLGPDAAGRADPGGLYSGPVPAEKRCNALSALPRGFDTALAQLEELDLAFNRIGAAGAAHLAGLTALTALDLWNNGIGAEGAAHLAGLAALTDLNLAFNEIGDAGAAHLAGLAELTALNLAFNEIGDAGAAHLAGLSALTELDLSGNEIGDAGAAHLAGLAELTALNLAFNGIGAAGAAHLAGLTELTDLNLSGNEIGAAGAAHLAGLSALTELNLSGNEIGAAGAAHLAGLAELTALNLEGNRIGAAGAAHLAGLAELTALDLSDNGIGDAGAAHLAGLAELTALNLAFNGIGAAGAAHLAGLTELTDLNLSGNGIGAAGAAHLAGLTELTALNLWDNGIGAAGAAHLAGLTELTALNLAFNEIEDLTPLEGLDRLRTLTLNGNKIAKLHEALWRKPSLKEVIFESGTLGAAPPELLSQRYDNNCLPRLRSYLDNLEAGEREYELRDVKLMILGNGQIGKTQLRRALCDKGYDESVSSTHGAEIEEAMLPSGAAPAPQRGFWTFRLKREKPEDPEATPLKIWDFGGQDIYLGAHALFLRSRAVFPIVWTPSAEDAREHLVDGVPYRNYRLEYWLRYVRTLGGARSPTLLVQSQCDAAGMEQAPPVAPDLRDSFAFRPLEIPYSARTRRGHDMLLARLRDAVEWLKAQRGVTLIGEGWAAVKTEIERLQTEDRRQKDPSLRRHRTLRFAEFHDLCQRLGQITKEADSKVLLGFLHDLGTVFYEKGRFHDLIILDQQWALDAIYALFERASGTHRLLQQGLRGRFTRADLGGFLWNQAGYTAAEQEIFLSMMVSCDICFVLERKEGEEARYVAPDLLPERDFIEADLKDRWAAAEESLAARYAFEMLPPNLLRGVMARIGARVGRAALYWRDGLHFRDDETGARGRIEQQRDEETGAGTLAARTQQGAAGALLATLCDLIEEEAERIGVEPSAVDRPPETARREEDRAPERRENPAEHLSATPEPVDPTACFISYAHGDASESGQDRQRAFDAVEARLRTLGLTPYFDAERLAFGHSIGRFMSQMAELPRAVVILSAKYVGSPYCMGELMRIFLHWHSDEDEFRRRVRVVRLSDVAIDLDSRLTIEETWIKERDALRETFAALLKQGRRIPNRDNEKLNEIALFADETATLLGLIEDALHADGPEQIDRLSF